jgi:predicted lysophospholipase L1 biosynthesis ABC-type transport system permease subunit
MNVVLVDMESARVELNTVVSRIEQAHPELSSGAEVGIRPFLEHHLGMNTRLALIALLVSVGMVLLIACANVTSLIFARSIARQREVAVRRALGGARFQIIRLFLTESLILAVAGGAGGVVLANWGLRGTISLSPLTVPRFDQAGIDEGVLGFALGLSLFAALVVGLVPALQLSNPALSKSLGASAPGEPRAVRGSY